MQERTDWALAQDVELERARSVIKELQALVAERTAWAQAADAETEKARAALADLQVEFEKRTAWAIQMQNELQARAEEDSSQQS